MSTTIEPVRVRRWTTRILDVFVPTHCVHCRAGGSLFCSKCIERLTWLEHPYCARCGRPISGLGPCHRCSSHVPAYRHVRSAVVFEGPVRSAVHALKYRNTFALAPLLADLMATAWPRRELPFDVVIPVPLHPRRRRQRGYNQSEELARRLAARHGWVMRADVLWRERHTRPQVGLSAEERQRNVQDAFVAVPARVAGRRIMLVDDVMTTGATLHAAANALLSAGAAEVNAYCLARASTPAHHTYR